MTEPVREFVAAGWLEPKQEDLPKVISALLRHLNLLIVWTNDTDQARKHNLVELVVEHDI